MEKFTLYHYYHQHRDISKKFSFHVMSVYLLKAKLEQKLCNMSSAEIYEQKLTYKLLKKNFHLRHEESSSLVHLAFHVPLTHTHTQRIFTLSTWKLIFLNRKIATY